MDCYAPTDDEKSASAQNPYVKILGNAAVFAVVLIFGMAWGATLAVKTMEREYAASFERLAKTEAGIADVALACRSYLKRVD